MEYYDQGGNMARTQKTVQPGSSKQEHDETAIPGAGTEKTEACRCKATSEMKPRELLRLMMSDLLFWKRPGKR
jgi:hypothetical protein